MKGDQEVLGEKKTHLPECEESHNQNQAFLTKRTFPFLLRIMFLFKSGLQISHIHKGIVQVAYINSYILLEPIGTHLFQSKDWRRAAEEACSLTSSAPPRCRQEECLGFSPEIHSHCTLPGKLKYKKKQTMNTIVGLLMWTVQRRADHIKTVQLFVFISLFVCQNIDNKT